jgi:TetR/AcrR family transcriptional regulator, mexJK operon transcriptional repressor
MTRKPQRTGRLPASEAAQIPDRLLDAAMVLFTETGYAGTTMEAIARQAGASSKTVYSRYANKEEVLAALVKRLLERSVPETVSVEEERREAPRTFLLRVAKELASLSEARETAGLNRLILAEAFRFPELSRLFIELHDRSSRVIREPLEAWREQGLLPDLPQPRLAAMLFVEMVASLPRIRALLGEPMSRRESNAMVQVAVDLFLKGCGYGQERP